MQDFTKMEPWKADGWFDEMERALARGEEPPVPAVPMSKAQADEFVNRVNGLLAHCQFDANANETARLLSWARLLVHHGQVCIEDE